MRHLKSLAALARLLPIAIVCLAATPARAAVMPLTALQMSGITPITFEGIAENTQVNGLTVGGVSFNYLINNLPSTSAVIDGGPGTTNNIAPPNVVNISGDNAGAILRMTFAAPAARLGYGFALLANSPVLNATTVSLYDASNALVGTLSADGALDPTFAGGFLGLQSTIPFVRADVTFSTVGFAFALDNIRVAPASAVPEPATLVLVGIGMLSAATRRLRKR